MRTEPKRKHITDKKTKSTFAREMKDPEFRKAFESERRKLEISELLVGIMEKENISVRQLAKKSNVSASVIQDLRSGARDNPTIDVLSKIIHSLNGTIEIKKNGRKLASV